MRMLKASGELDLAAEPLRTQCRGEFGMEDLQGDRAVVLEISCEVDRRHPPAAELALERVAAAEGGLQMSEEISQVMARGGVGRSIIGLANERGQRVSPWWSLPPGNSASAKSGSSRASSAGAGWRTGKTKHLTGGGTHSSPLYVHQVVE